VRVVNWDQVIQLIEIVIVPLLGWFIYEIRQTRNSIQSLNVTMAMAMLKITHIEEDHGRRIVKLENRFE
jgi:hypothetical protein